MGRDAAAESHYLGTSHIVVPMLRLHVDHLQTQLVLIDSTVYTTVA
jgi:hypothetical protein